MVEDFQTDIKDNMQKQKLGVAQEVACVLNEFLVKEEKDREASEEKKKRKKEEKALKKAKKKEKEKEWKEKLEKEFTLTFERRLE